MLILAIDLGKFKSVACRYDTQTHTHQFRSVPTTPQALHDLLVELEPNQVVFEVGSAAGWLADLCQALALPFAVANPNHEAWRWKSVKRKTDRDDALKLARLWSMAQLPTVTLPSRTVRQWKSLIAHRHTLVGRRTAIKNSIRALLDRQGLRHPTGKGGWTAAAVATLHVLAQPLAQVTGEELWRGQLHLELTALAQVEQLLDTIEVKLTELAAQQPGVALLQSIPGVGPRLAEVVVAVLGDPQRFRTGKQVGAYAGLAPRLLESGTMSRSGGITGRGHRLLRALLVEVAWLMQRYNGHLRGVFERVCRGSRTRRKVAVVATARRLLVICWAMLRDGTRWREPAGLAS